MGARDDGIRWHSLEEQIAIIQRPIAGREVAQVAGDDRACIAGGDGGGEDVAVFGVRSSHRSVLW
jgi:hypothetical protein